MRLGDVMQLDEANNAVGFQCRGCNQWLKRDEYEDVGSCSEGCCDDLKCKKCGHITRVEWPD